MQLLVIVVQFAAARIVHAINLYTVHYVGSLDDGTCNMEMDILNSDACNNMQFQEIHIKCIHCFQLAL